MVSEGPESGTENPAASGGDPVTVTLPDDVGEWLDEQVADADRDRADVLRDLAVAYREIEIETDDGVVDDVDRHLAAQREEYVELVEDVRERVVDLRRELDALADRDHDRDHDHGHDEVADRTAVEDLAEKMQQLERRTEAGFENYEAVLEEVTDAVDRLGDRFDGLATTVVELRERSRHDDRDDNLPGLKRRANEAGVREATCGACGATLSVGLLTAAECPHCRSRFADVEDGGRLIGSATLVVDDPPALDTSRETGGDTA
jgi:predicted Zn-ribbon and HTH transcriptional regulator